MSYFTALKRSKDKISKVMFRLWSGYYPLLSKFSCTHRVLDKKTLNVSAICWQKEKYYISLASIFYFFFLVMFNCEVIVLCYSVV